MSDRERIIKAFRTRIISDSEEFNTVEIPVGEAVQILDLLKEQEPKPVRVVKNAYNHEFYYCPRCDRSFYDLSFGKPKFCDKCGQAVIFDA